MLNWVTAFHVIFMVAWYAGLLYLPRLFVYHAEVEDRTGRDRFCVMERRSSILMSIAALATVALGIWLVVLKGGDWAATNGWFHIKLTLVVLLIGYHGWCQAQVKKFRENRARGTLRYYRLMCEIPTVILVLIMIDIFVKPI